MDQALYLIIAAAVFLALGFILITLSGESLTDYFKNTEEMKNESDKSFGFDLNLISSKNGGEESSLEFDSKQFKLEKT
jgi:hypothetical protein